MGWNDERIEMLKKLWADGLSASQIAAQLGGITRNAVIGKVHRLGLSGRAKTPSSAVPRVRRQRTTPRSSKIAGNAAVLLENFDQHKLDPRATTVPTGPRASITQLTEDTCRWPIGDPGAEGFCYCGTQTKKNPGGMGIRDKMLPYCHYHARVAYQPLAERRAQQRTRQRQNETTLPGRFTAGGFAPLSLPAAQAARG